MYLKKILICCLSLFALIITFQKSNAQENGKLDAIFVAKEYSNSIVKILLFDSVAEKAVPGSGYVGRASGFIVTEDGIIFTNKHVIEYCMDYMQYETFNPSDKKISDEMNNYNPSNLSDPEYISIKSIHRAIPIIQVFTDKDENNYKLYQAKLISLDSENFDGAILQIISDMKGNPINEKFHPVPIGNSDETNQGEDICVFGFPAQYDAGFDLMLKDQSTLTFGKHSGFDYVFNSEYGYIKTDASINSGNSGGPVFNSSNKVIGIATASGDKTNIGLIGGINAMYNLVSTQLRFLEAYEKTDITHSSIGISISELRQGRLSKLLKELSDKGLTTSKRKPTKNTTSLFVKQQLPTQKIINKSNNLKKIERQFKGKKFYSKFSFLLSETDNYTLEKINTTGNGIIPNPNLINPNYTLNVTTNNQFGFEFGRTFILGRFSKSAKIALDWSLISSYGTRDWTNANIYTDTLGSKITYNSKASFFRFGQSLGLNFSYLFLRKFPVDFYYKFTGAVDEGGQIGILTNTDTISNANSMKITSNGFSFINSIGFNFSYSFCFIGLEYSFGKSDLNYELPFIANNPYYSGTTMINSYYANSISVSGKNSFNSIKLTLGFIFGGDNKWKKLLVKKYKESL